MRRLTIDEQARYKEYEGIDIDIEISLFEYGRIYKPIYNDNGELIEYHIVYGVVHNGEDYTEFDYSFLSKKDYIDLLKKDWVKIDSVLEYASTTLENMQEFNECNIDILINYHGIENILGGSYSSKIIGVEETE